MVLHLASDLMLVGKVSSWARANAIAYRNVSGVAKLNEALGECDVHCVVVDLQLPALDLAGVAASVRSANKAIELAGYAQHVMTDLIASAQEAGFDAVLTRGQFDRQFPQVISN